MTVSEKIKVLARSVRGLIEALHDAAPECSRCPLNSRETCIGGNAVEDLDEIIGD